MDKIRDKIENLPNTPDNVVKVDNNTLEGYGLKGKFARHTQVVNHVIIYRQIHKLRKGYVFTGIGFSVHGGGVFPSMHWGRHPPRAGISQHALGQTLPMGRHIPACTGADISQHALGQTPPWADTSQHALGQTPPWADTSQHALGQTPPMGRHIPACTGADPHGQTYPSMHWDRPPWADTSQHALGQTPPHGQTYPSMHWGRHTPLGRHPSMHWDRHPLGRHIPACSGADTPHGQTYPSMHLGRPPSPADGPRRRPLQRRIRILPECILVTHVIEKLTDPKMMQGGSYPSVSPRRPFYIKNVALATTTTPPPKKKS